MKTILLTGGCGFIGSNMVKLLLTNTSYRIVNLDNLTYAGNLENLKEFEGNTDYIFVKGDICDESVVNSIFEKYNPDYVINMAAESHVDRSIDHPDEFVRTNVLGTINILNQSIKYGIERYVQISTDEVYGSLGSEGYFTEKTPMSPNSPYSASKASADSFVRSYGKTYGLDFVITRCSNNYGPYQFPEKLIPLVINNAVNDISIPVYGDGKNVRDWIYVEDHCWGILKALEMGRSGNVYNFGGDSELTNIVLIQKILSQLGKTEDLIKFIADRPGHDFRYAIEYSKASIELDWNPKLEFDDGLKSTINWYLDNKLWMNKITSGDYREYYKLRYME